MQCPRCDRFMVRERNYRHTRGYGDKVKHYRCSYCHMRKMVDVSEPWWKKIFRKKCPRCSRVMVRARTETTTTERNMVWLCPTCCKCVVKTMPWWRRLFSRP